MKKTKGFTLIELIAVIFILALILLIVVPIINDNISKSKLNLSEEQIRQIETSARQWGIDNLTVKDGASSESFVTIRTLQKEGYLDDKGIIDAKTKEEVPLSTKICITYESNQFVYEYKGEC